MTTLTKRVTVYLDPDDLAAFEARKHEPTVTFENFVKELKRDGKI